MKPTVALAKLVRIFFDVLGKLIFGLRYWGKNPTPLPPVSNLLLVEPATSLALKIRTKKISSEEVVKAFISRIEQVNPILNAVVDNRYEAALDEAREVDKFLRSNDYDEAKLAKEKPFFGVPFSIKDCFEVKGLRHTAGLWARRNFIGKKNSEVVQLMIDAGAIILCVTNVSELCMWLESSNTIYGRTNNPYDTTRIVGGSSGGEGCNLSSCGTPFGIGSDIGGSIRMPCFFNGIFGHKPSMRIVSNAGQEPVAVGELQDFLVTGPMCRFACDLIPMYKVLAASNAHLLDLDKKVDLRNIKIFYMEENTGCVITTPVERELKEAQMKVIKYFKQAYNIQAVKLNLKKLMFAPQIYFAKLTSVKEAHKFASELALKKGEINVWFELLKAIFKCSYHTIPALLLCLLEKNNDAHQSSPYFAKAISACQEIKSELASNLGENGIFLFPPHPVTAPYHSQPILRPFDFTYTGIFNPMGFPITQCPLGLNSKGHPLGVQVLANMNMDHLTLGVAAELEKVFGGWQCPSKIL